MRIRIGCSGWNYASWRHGVFYPQRLPARRWLAAYAERFDTVEVNATFYRLPKREAVERWAQETPEGFTFAVKVSRYVTHVKRCARPGSISTLLLARIEPLIAAGSWGRCCGSCRRRSSATTSGSPTRSTSCRARSRHAFEFRHASWFAEPVMELLRAHDVALVIADRPEIRSFQTRELTTDFTFVRFHHGTRGRRGNYSPAELADWATAIRELVGRSRRLRVLQQRLGGIRAGQRPRTEGAAAEGGPWRSGMTAGAQQALLARSMR